MSKDFPWEIAPESRYRRDNQFRQLVDMMEAHMHAASYTPTEMREASLLAAIHFERHRVRTLAGYSLDEKETREAWSIVQQLYDLISKEPTR